MRKPEPPSFEATYPAITRWIKKFGRIEVGTAGFTDSFVKAIDRDGVPWGGKGEYESIDEALRDMEEGIKALLEAQRLDKRSSARQRPTTRSARGGRKRPTGARQDQPLSDDERKVIQKVEKLARIADELRQGQDFPVTRLTTLKGLCEDPKAAGAFALFLTRKVQRTMREKKGPQRYRQLVNRAVREMRPYLEQPTDERRERLWSLWHEMKEEQSEYKPISWGVLRIVKSMELLVAEKCLESVLRPHEAPSWLYEAARDYAERSDARHPYGLTPRSAPLVEEIAGFWRRYHGIKR
jgi:hypothetical protein